MIEVDQYFTNPTTGRMKVHTAAQRVAAFTLLEKTNALVDEAVAAGRFDRPIDRDTGTEISGAKNGTGGGGFREEHEPPSEYSSHKILWALVRGRWVKDDTQAKAAVDHFDPNDELDSWLDEFEDGQGGNTKLEEHGLYREHPDHTRGWCHLTTRAPKSGKRTFLP